MQNVPTLPSSKVYTTTPPGSPLNYPPCLLLPGSPLGVSLESQLSMFGTFRHSHSCPNKIIDIGKQIIHPNPTYPQARQALGCTNMCHIQLGNATGTSRPIAAPAPFLKSALSKISRNDNVEGVDQQAVAEIAVRGSFYHPTQEFAKTADPAASPPDLIEHSPTTTLTPEILGP